MKKIEGNKSDAWNEMSTDALCGLLSRAIPSAPTIGNDGETQAKQTIALLREFKPRDQIEVMLASQMLAIHTLTMRLSGLAINETHADRLLHLSNNVGKLSRTYTQQMDALNKYRGKGKQQVVVKHVHVEAGANAVIGSVTRGTDNE